MVDERDAQVVDLASEAVPRHRGLRPGAAVPRSPIPSLRRFPGGPPFDRPHAFVSNLTRMRVRVRLFASLREAAGRPELAPEPPDRAAAGDAGRRRPWPYPRLAPPQRS